jgi:addiction module HigA family antidote
LEKAHLCIHPGEILLEEFLKPYTVSQHALAKAIGVSPRRINEIVRGVRPITPDTALRMSRAFDVSDRFWLNLQNRFDLEKAKDSLENELMNISPLPAVLAN